MPTTSTTAVLGEPLLVLGVGSGDAGAAGSKRDGTGRGISPDAEHAIARVEAFAKEGGGGHVGEVLCLDPTLNSHARLCVHRVAEHLGLLHSSEGTGRSRRIVVRRQRRGGGRGAATPRVGALPMTELRRELSDEGRRMMREALLS